MGTAMLQPESNSNTTAKPPPSASMVNVRRNASDSLIFPLIFMSSLSFNNLDQTIQYRLTICSMSMTFRATIALHEVSLTGEFFCGYNDGIKKIGGHK